MAREVIVTPPERVKRCETCALYDAQDRNCHALLPVAVPFPGPNGQMAVAGVFPAMAPSGWCAKWEAVPLS